MALRKTRFTMAGLYPAAGAHAGALRDAVVAGDVARVAGLLAKGANVNAEDKDGRTPLHAAARHPPRGMAELLLAKGANVHVQDSDVAELLLARGANVNAHDNGGGTPLHMAAQQGHHQVAELLLAEGAMVNAEDNEGETPLDYAKRAAKHDMLGFLKSRGAKPGKDPK
jgi:uncharacterized protein